MTSQNPVHCTHTVSIHCPHHVRDDTGILENAVTTTVHQAWQYDHHLSVAMLVNNLLGFFPTSMVAVGYANVTTKMERTR